MNQLNKLSSNKGPSPFIPAFVLEGTQATNSNFLSSVLPLRILLRPTPAFAGPKRGEGR